VLLYPEGLVKLNGSAGEIMTRCDGERSIAAIVTDLERAFNAKGWKAMCSPSSNSPASSAGWCGNDR